MNYIRLFLNNKRLISFGFFVALFSSFGQTFLISLYVPDIMKAFNLDSFLFGMMYSAATILSGATLAFIGKFIDHYELRNYTLMAVSLLIGSCFFMAISINLFFIFFGLWGLRLAGQGLFSHISSTSISKVFSKTRGMALSLSVLGHSAGEAFFPVAIGSLILYTSWRISMAFSAVFIAIVLIPFIFFAFSNKNIWVDLHKDHTGNANLFSRRQLLKDNRFYIIAFSSSALFFTITGLFFYQLFLAQEKGWPVKWLTISFAGFAAGRIVFSLLSGKLVDKFSALAIFPFCLLPFVFGLVCLALFNHPIVAPVYFVLTGISVGLHSTLNPALLAEVYGTANLGSIRSLSAAVMVFSTALGPALFGFLLEKGFNFTIISIISAGIVLSAAILSSRLRLCVNLLK